MLFYIFSSLAAIHDLFVQLHCDAVSYILKLGIFFGVHPQNKVLRINDIKLNLINIKSHYFSLFFYFITHHYFNSTVK